MTPQGPRIFTVNPQSFAGGRFAMAQASPFKRLMIVLLLMLVAIPLLALGMVMLLIVFMVALFKSVFASAGKSPARPTGRNHHDPMNAGQSAVGMNHKDDSMRENVKVIER